MQRYADSRQRAGRFFDRLDHIADSAPEIRDGVVDGLAPNQHGLFRALPMQRHRIGNVKTDDLRYDSAASCDPYGRKRVSSRKRIQPRFEYVVAGGAAQARVKAERGLLLDGVSAGFGIAFIELAGQKSLEVSSLKLPQNLFVPCHDLADARQRPHSRKDICDCTFQIGRDQRPYVAQNVQGFLIQAVHRQSSVKGLD